MSGEIADPCVWTETDECWETDCGRSFLVNEGAPVENGMRFCCFCGRSLVEERPVSEEDVDESPPTG